MARPLLFFLFLLLIFVFCGRAGRVTLQPPVRIDPPPIVDGELNQYEIKKMGDSGGMVALRKVLIQRIASATPPLFQVTIVDQDPETNIATDSIVLCLDREDMSPLSSIHFSRPPKQQQTTAAQYQGDFVTIVTAGEAGEFKRDIPIGAMTYDVNQVATLGRALRFGKPRPVYILVVIPVTSPSGGMSVHARITPAGVDTVTTPAGIFPCSKLLLEINGTKETFWFEQIGARRLIQHYNETTKEIMLLSGTTYLLKASL